MSALIKHLQDFNRKERFILLREALGADTFTLGDDFRERLRTTIDVAIPPDAFVAMDYHLDWLQMALYFAATPSPPSPIPNDDLFMANPEDIDLLVAFDGDDTTHIVLIEAKMETGWITEQLDSKAQRLGRIFGAGRPGADLATPHLVLASPKKSERALASAWPESLARRGAPRWMVLPRPPGLQKVTRCTVEKKQSKAGRYLKIHS